MEQLFAAMMGGGGPMGMMMGGGGRGGGGRRRRGSDVGIRHECTLEECFSGAEDTVPRDKTCICDDCQGSGAKRAGGTTVCRDCRGQGRVMGIAEIAPGFATRTQVPCEACAGQGSVIAERDRCTRCKGKRLVEESRPLKLKIVAGMRHGEQIPFLGEGDENPARYQEPGDIIVVLQVKEHPVFTREGDDLRMKHKISLAESLCGAHMQFRHLDGRVIHVKAPPGRLVEPDSCFVVRGEGMPVLNRSGRNGPAATGRRGDLYIDFQVEFPRHLTEAAIAKLRLALPPAPVPPAIAEASDDNHVEECYAAPQALADVRNMIKKSKESSDDDDDANGGGGPGGGMGGGPGVRCAHA
jgi:DnaJ family protein A protein 2